MPSQFQKGLALLCMVDAAIVTSMYISAHANVQLTPNVFILYLPRIVGYLRLTFVAQPLFLRRQTILHLGLCILP